MQFPKLPIEPESSELPVQFFYEDTSFELPNPSAITQWLSQVAEMESCRIIGIDYIFCSDEYLYNINLEYLQHDYYTDIITFPYSERPDLQGDLYISIDRVKDNAHALQAHFEQELLRVMVHGLLHLAGYGDKTDAEVAHMRARENFYLAHSVAL